MDRGDNITYILSKTYIQGSCYYKSKKYCPTQLHSCNSQINVGYKWSLKGVCQEKYKSCPNITVHEGCNNISCPKHSYFCNPEGCLPESVPCHHQCPQMKQHKNNNSFVPCGNKCIAKDTARDMYSCGKSCLEKSDVCRHDGNISCSQHYSVCGDNCVDRFSQDLWESHTGRPLYHTCDGQCFNYSTPCHHICSPGYWLCYSGDQCILSGVSIADVNMSSLCDGKLDCQDWSDESFIECVKVYYYEISVTLAILLIIMLIALYIQYIIKHEILIIKFYGRSKLLDMHIKATHLKEDIILPMEDN